ncbi:MAG: hypothetical protein SGI88_18005 [Candidatus Hydrogenedentes bacterium]|nr:hypothetical protein [Candidatus Hydrogenedentota bacterium]
MGAASQSCDKCRNRLPEAVLNSPGLMACPYCRTPLQFLVFPAYARTHAAGQLAERVIADVESSCFFHSAKKATIACEGCGRFLCALCDIEFDGKHVCAKCLEAGKSKGTMDKLEVERYRYDVLATNLVVLGLLLTFCMPYIAPVLGAAAIYICIRYWNKPMALMSPGKGRLAITIVLALVQVGLSSLMFLSILGLMFTI